MNPTIKAKLVAIKKARKAYAAAMAQHGKTLVQEMVVELMVNHPGILAIRWEQFTPWSMDGDRCEFSVNEPDVKLSDSFLESLPGDGCYYLEYDTGFGSLDTFSKSTPDAIKSMNKSILKLFRSLELVEDCLLECFGDHCAVIITNKGKVSVERIVHD